MQGPPDFDTPANSQVLEFYKHLPFNYRGSLDAHVANITRHDPLEDFPFLAPILGPRADVLDVGCGVGWFCNGLAHHHAGLAVTGIDFNPRAIERARSIAAALGSGVRFEIADLFAWRPPKLQDLVVSLGVLHHTNDCLAGLRTVAEFVAPGGHLCVGLYHAHGRRPFLRYFRALRKQGTSEEEMFRQYRSLHATVVDDETHALSWFRDQVQHPHETQHTLAELLPVLEQSSMSLVSTSINRFRPYTSIEELLTLEQDMEAYAQAKLDAREFFPGFFVLLCRRT